jgi:nickel transport protein
VLDGESELLDTLALDPDGTLRIPLDSVDYAGGLVVEVDTGSHEDYWIITPDDIARNCGS